jgi:sugar/nucleoside kinase (ribokinase family)
VRLPANHVQGAAGAGDAFAAGVLLGLHDEWSMAESLKLGVCAAAASLAHPTCSEGIVSRVECLALGTQFGFNEASPI